MAATASRSVPFCASRWTSLGHGTGVNASDAFDFVGGSAYGPAAEADEPAPVYTIRQHEFDIPEFKTNPDDKTPQGLSGSNAYSNADY